MKVEVTRYRKADGYATRYWSVTVNGALLAVTVYRKGAEAVARAITTPTEIPHVPILEDSAEAPSSRPHAPAGLATYRTR